jgi:hypothetical protein
MSSGPQVAATLDDLYRVKGKAELIGGRIVPIVPIIPTGRLPNLVAVRILRSLAAHEAGTQVVLDVDPIAERVHVSRAGAPDQPELYLRGQEVDAEPAVPGWRVAVDWIFA